MTSKRIGTRTLLGCFLPRGVMWVPQCGILRISEHHF